ncbi:hypothetical protein XENTR_v10006284 [Xenopus tropicalis]|nr:hypothetical protein XENTR_v10006284 [Xenopus tropicalis]
MCLQYTYCGILTGIIFILLEISCCFLSPNITEPPKNSFWEVKLKAAIDLQCSATVGVISEDIVEMYWLIDGNFTYNYQNMREGNMTNVTRGELLYLNSVLHILEVLPENYNIPIKCIVSSTSGGDTSTLYLTSSAAERIGKYAV